MRLVSALLFVFAEWAWNVGCRLTGRLLIQRFVDSNFNSYLDCESFLIPSLPYELLVQSNLKPLIGAKLTCRTGIHHYRGTTISVTFMKIS